MDESNYLMAPDIRFMALDICEECIYFVWWSCSNMPGATLEQIESGPKGEELCRISRWDFKSEARLKTC